MGINKWQDSNYRCYKHEKCQQISGSFIPKVRDPGFAASYEENPKKMEIAFLYSALSEAVPSSGYLCTICAVSVHNLCINSTASAQQVHSKCTENAQIALP